MNFQYTLASPLCKVFPNGQNLSPLKEPHLTGLRGETVSFQIAYLWNEWGREYGQVEVVPPCQGQVRVRTVELVPSQYPCHQRRDPYYLAAEPGLYPDLLRDLGPQGFPLITGQWRCLWVDVALDGPAGAFPVELRLRAREEELALVKLTCEVLDMDLPLLPIPHTEWFHSDCLANYYGVEVFSERWWELVEAFVRTAAQRHCNMLLTPVFTPPLDTAPGGERRTVQLVDVEDQGGAYRFGFEKFRRWIRLARDCGMEYIEISHLFSQWGAKAAPKIMGTKEGRYQQLFGWNTQAAGPEYGEFLHQFLTALKPELEALDIAGRTYFHVSDEPTMEQLDSYRQAYEAVAEDLKGYPMLDALSDHAFFREGLVEQPVCALDHIQPFLRDRPKKLWGYYCTAQCVDVSNRFMVMPGQRTRVLGALLYKHQLAGFLHWGYNFYNSQFSRYPIDPYRVTDADGAFPSGDSFLVYPGPEGQPEESLRLMHMDQAMSDYCALTALEKLAGREKVMEYLALELEFDRYPREGAGLLELRERINGAIRGCLAAE